ncbi:MAG: hypothetical protein K6V36_15220 [Anaerolineae bacterium]|nr:hypothetical protein [Anaerolineae bacterium]
MVREFAVPFGRPRDLVGVRSQPAFGVLVEAVWDALRSEVSRMGWEVPA